MSGPDAPIPFVAIPDALAPMLEALQSLIAPGVPPLAIVGGLAVNLRLSVGGDAHRTTRDIDVVSGADVPSVIDVLGAVDQATRTQTVTVGEFDVDVISTLPMDSTELDGLEDANRLFLVGHRWAFDTATRVRLGVRGGDASVELSVATPAGLVAAKNHAVGYPRAIRRATKHGGDLYDVFRLLEVFDADGSIGREISTAPHGLGALIATVLTDEILSNPARATHQMSIASLSNVSVEQVTETIETFVTAVAP